MSAVSDIVLTPDPRLTEMCQPIDKIDGKVCALAKRMLKDMYAAEGCGLAAPQVGELVRLVVIDVDYDGENPKTKNPYVLVNPKVIAADGDPRPFNEGCLSFPGISVEVTRPSHFVVQAMDLEGDLLQYEAENNLLAVCLQHEIDHLNGVTMVDHLSPTKRLQALRACEQAIEAGARPGETSTN